MSKTVHWAEIDRLVLAHHREDPTSSLDALERYLRKWWCITYERPFKDPLLDQYTLDELVYEFLSKHYLKPENDPDKIEAERKKASEDEEWASRMVEQELKKMQANVNQLAEVASDKTPKKSRAKKKKQDIAEELPDIISTKFDLPDPGDNKT
jgi:hypothetical protein